MCRFSLILTPLVRTSIVPFGGPPDVSMVPKSPVSLCHNTLDSPPPQTFILLLSLSFLELMALSARSSRNMLQ